MSEVSFTRTRQSIGSQLREAFDDQRARGAIQSWEFLGGIGPAANAYWIVDGYGRSGELTVREAIDLCNAYGYNVYFGKV